MTRHRDERLLIALGARLKAMRSARRITQEALAAALGVRPPTLSRLENGQRALSLSLLARAAAVLDCSLVDLVDVDEGMPPLARPLEHSELLALWGVLDERDRGIALRMIRDMARR